MRKPKTFFDSLWWDQKAQNKDQARLSKNTRIQNMLATGRPVYCNFHNVRLQISHCIHDKVFFKVVSGIAMYDISQVSRVTFDKV